MSSNFVEIHRAGGYESDLDGKEASSTSTGAERKELYQGYVPQGGQLSSKYEEDAKQRRREYMQQMSSLTEYEKHQKYVAEYGSAHIEKSSETDVDYITDYDILKDNHRFIRSAEDSDGSSWQKRMTQKHYDQLYREYCIGDFSLYKEGKVGLRWRVKSEVMSGKGQYICGNKTCKAREALKSYEVNFAYVEAGKSRQALVKIRLCTRCAYKLHYKKIKQMQAIEKRSAIPKAD